MSDNFEEFRLDLDGKLDKLGLEASEACTTVTLEVLNRTILKTPRDRGVLVNNWFTSVGNPSSETTESEDLTGSQAINRAVQAMAGFEAGPTIWVSNNSPYAAVWEFGTFIPPDPGPSKDPRQDRLGKVLVVGGYSVQAPEGYLGVSIQEVVTALES